MQRGPVLRGDGAEDQQLTAHDSDRVQERQSVRVFVAHQCRLMHESADGEMEQQYIENV